MEAELAGREILELLVWVFTRHHGCKRFQTPKQAEHEFLFLNDCLFWLPEVMDSFKVSVLERFEEVVVVETLACLVEDHEFVDFGIGLQQVLLLIIHFIIK